MTIGYAWPEVKRARTDARREIIHAANAHLAKRGSYRELARRNLQEAVFIVRQGQCVDADILVAAGFNAPNAKMHPRREGTS